MKKIASLSALCGVGLLFTACGDDVTEIHNTSGVESYAAIKELPDCTAENAGELAFVSDSAKVYYCAEDGWQTLNGKDGKDGADGKDGENGENGSDGDNGTDGEKGSAGAGCTATPLADGSGYKIVCGGDSVGVVLNGAQGLQGEKGEDGISYEPLCSGVTYDPATQFCRHDEVYDLCGNQAYEPLTHFCAADGNAYEKCGGVDYVPADEFCQDGAVYPRCGSDKVDYDGHVFKCENGALFSLCSSYDAATEVCYDGVIMRNCGNELYDKDLYECVDGVVTNPACGDKTYDKANGEECRDNVVYAVCGEGFYNKESQRCENGKAIDVLIDLRDNNVYKITTIGSQTWMAENLNYAGTTSWCPNGTLSYCDIYGRLYQWADALTVCPAGWHLPTNEEWQTLNDFIQAEKGENVGAYLKASSGWGKSYEDPYGFAALPAGIRGTSRIFGLMYSNTQFWSVTECGSVGACHWDLNKENENIISDNPDSDKTDARSVRCLKD